MPDPANLSPIAAAISAVLPLFILAGITSRRLGCSYAWRSIDFNVKGTRILKFPQMILADDS